MKPLILTLTIALLMVGTTFAQQKQGDMNEKKQQMQEMIQDSTMRAMMMKHMAQNPEMRKQMMQHMMKSGKMDHSGMKGNMQKMMDDPQMKERMQKHMEMMQSMMEDGEMNHSKMMEMAGDSSMMKMHMTCMQMMQGDVMDQKGMMNNESNKGNKHQQHHN